MNIKYMTPGELVPYDKNPRINDQAVDLVANSIREFGFKQPIVIDRNNVIIAGHTRWKAARELGLERVPCIMADDLTPAQVKAYRLADNKVAEASEWDFDLLDEEPTYNVAIENSQGMTIENDDMDSANFQEFLTAAFENMSDHLKAGGAFYIWYASHTHMDFEQSLNNAGLEVREQLIWNKNSLVLGRQDYQWKHEPCLYGWKDGASHYFINNRALTTVIDDDELDLDAMKKDELKALVQRILETYPDVTVINEKKPAKNDLHPTMKPIKLIARLVKNSSRTRENVLDLFGGSGSTLIACEQLNRKCFMMEYDPRYADVIIDRWEQQTGEKAVLANG